LNQEAFHVKWLAAISRREFARILAAAAIVRPSRAADKLEWSAEKSTGLALERHYRADAQVLLLGIPVLRREGVGGGSARWHEFESGGLTRLLEFSGYSLPEHAAGLNRLGVIREMLRNPGRPDLECIYFGVMTASPEESAEDARKALHSAAKEQMYTAIQGRITGSETETAIAHFLAPSAIHGGHSTELVMRAQQVLLADPQPAPATRGEAGSLPFLQTLAHLRMQPDGRDGRYTYGGKTYRLQLARAADPKSTEYFRGRKLIGDSARVVRVSGRLRREASGKDQGGKEIDFRVWISTSGERALPLRIEYQAKAYLRLVFEAAGA
jgi:hypothetical protein